jgi:hypothetical protein
VLTGYARREKGGLDLMADVVGSLAFSAPANLRGLASVVGSSLAARALSDELRQMAGKEWEAFTLDFRIEPPRWNSTNDDFWDEIMEFFDL